MRMTKMMMSGILAAAMVGCGGMDESQTDTELGQSEGAATVHTFGVHATDAYEANWQDALTGFQWDMTSRFINQLRKTDTNKFYYNLQGKAYYWHDTGDHAVNSLEDVDLFFTTTHGGAWNDSAGNSNAVWAMWNNGSVAWSRQMRLGDELTGLSIFAQVSCDTLTTADGNVWSRWGPIFAGGLRVALGSHDLLANSSTKKPVGENFAIYLQNGYKLGDAWYWALSNPSTGDDIAVMYNGTDATDCSNRYNMTWQNFTNYARRRDGNNGYMCWWQWDDA
jgi:hypothetical protein